MKTQIIDNNTFVVGEDLTFEVGDDVPLNDDESQLLQRVRDLETEMLEVKQNLVNACHMADKNFAPGLGENAHRLSTLGIEHVYVMSKFINSLQDRLGGLLPLEFTKDKMGVKVRSRRQEAHGLEDLNYTVTNVKRSLSMNRLEDQRILAIEMAGSKENVVIDLSMNEERKFQPIESVIGDVPDLVAFAELLEKATFKLLKERFYPGNSIVLVKIVEEGEDPDKAWVINMNLQANNPNAAKARWDAIGKFAEEVKPTAVASVHRKPGESKDEKSICISILGRASDGLVRLSKEAKILMGKPQTDDDRISLDSEWAEKFDAQGGEQKYAELLG